MMTFVFRRMECPISIFGVLYGFLPLLVQQLMFGKGAREACRSSVSERVS